MAVHAQARAAARPDRLLRKGDWPHVTAADKPNDVICWICLRAGCRIPAGFSTPLRPSLRLGRDGITHPRWSIGIFARAILRDGMPHFQNNDATRGAPILSPDVECDFSDRGHMSWQYVAMIRRQWRDRLVIKGVLHVDDARIARDAGADAIIVSNHDGRRPGARFVFVGRPFAHAAAVGGEAGVDDQPVPRRDLAHGAVWLL